MSIQFQQMKARERKSWLTQRWPSAVAEHERLTGYLSQHFSDQFKTWARGRLSELEAMFPQLKGVTHGYD